MGSDKQAGNVLFLILIAVALFAALSYVVTSSLRSNENALGDEGNLSAAVLLNQVTYLRTEVLKAYYASDGTALSRDPGQFYDPKLGRTITLPSMDWIDPEVSTKFPAWDTKHFTWMLDLARFYTASGADVGTSNNDLYIHLIVMNEALCYERSSMP